MLETKKTYHKNGKLQSEEQYINLIKNGYSKWFYRNGIQSYESFFINNSTYGISKYWSGFGNLKFINTSSHNKLNGINIDFSYEKI